jgi:hypothetical protein
VPPNIISRWRGTVTSGGSKFIVDLTVKQADLGSPVGPYSLYNPPSGLCTFSTSLLDSGVDYIEFAVTLINGANCVSGVVRLQLQGDGTVYYEYERGTATGILMRYAS